MITREDADRLRDQLLGVLAEDTHNTQRLLERLDAISRESGIGAHAALLLILTHRAFTEDEASGHWRAIVEHRATLSTALGREAGLRVAVLDYFMNVNRQLMQPALIDLELLEATARDATRDALTGLATDRRFRAALQQELRRARRYDQQAAVVAFDFDDFAALNARVGEIVGDRLLREAAILLSNKIRDIDVAARPGEDEVVLLLPETDRGGAVLVAERFRSELQAFFAGREGGGAPVALTISGGVAAYPADATTPERLMERAAQALYQAKAQGKNRVQAFQHERRSFLRFDLQPGRFEIEVLASATASPGSPRNLSRNGVLFASPEPLEVGEEIEIRLAGPTGETGAPITRVRGRVVRLEELPDEGEEAAASGDRYEIGVAFDGAVGGHDPLHHFLHLSQARDGEPEP